MRHVSVLTIGTLIVLSLFCLIAYGEHGVRLPHRKRFVSALIGSDGRDRLLRIRFDEDKIVIYGGPSGGTYDLATGTELISLGPSVIKLRLPVYYTYQGDPSVNDPIQTNERVSYAGVLGLGPRSPLWAMYQFDSWRLEPDALVLGSGVPLSNDPSVLRLPSSVRVDPRNDFTSVADLSIYLSWLSTLPDKSKNNSGSNGETLNDALQLLSQVGPRALSEVESASSELESHLKIYSRTSRSGGGEFGYGRTARLDSAMILLPEDSRHDGIEMDAYTVDSISGNYVELVRFVPVRQPNNFSSLVRKRDPITVSAPIISVGLIHASDWIISATADLETVLLSPSPSGPFSPQPSDFVWLFFACLLLSYLFDPGLSEKFQRGRRLFMPMATKSEYELELVKAHEDWTLVLLVARIVLALSAWVIHMSLVVYRPLRQMEPRGWFITYYVSMAYIIWHVLTGPVRYPNRHHVSRYSISLKLASILLLSVHYWNGLCLLLMVILSFDCARLAMDRMLSNFIRPDESYSIVWHRIGQLVSLGEAIWLAWMYGFYILDRVIRSAWPRVGNAVMVELCVVFVTLSMFSLAICVLEESIRLAASARYVSALFNEKLTSAIAATKESKIKLNNSSSNNKTPITHTAPSSSGVTGTRFHFGMGLPSVESAAAMLTSGNSSLL